MLRRVLSIILSVAFVISILAITSCSIDFRSDVEKAMDKLLKSNSYTVTVSNDLGEHKYMISNGTAYYFEDYDEAEIITYLYNDGTDYYEAQVIDGEEDQAVEKTKLEKDSYAIKYMNMVQECNIVNEIFSYRHILDMAEKTDSGYKYSEQESTEEYTYRIIYTIELNGKDIVLTKKYESKKERYEEITTISNIGKTKIEIPENVLTK
jgi:pyruvate/2-oxoacid:ferredoxin oxidoreductase beta subunit